MAGDPNVLDEDILAYSLVEEGRGPFNPRIRPDPEYVRLPEGTAQLESALGFGNWADRWRRHGRFRNRVAAGIRLPVLVSEGDSWFQFPLIIKDVIDHLGDNYLIWSLGAAGDTASNMVGTAAAPGEREYLDALRTHGEAVRAFLFSGAGNDVIGIDPITERPVLEELVRPFNGNETDIDGHIDEAALARRLGVLEAAYGALIESVRGDDRLGRLPILLHGYDYVYPWPWGGDDPRDPKHANPNDKWIGAPMTARGIMEDTLRRALVSRLIDRLYALLFDLAGDSAESNIWVVDCRGALPELGDWVDEIHATSAGFGKVAARFEATLHRALGTNAPPS